jgi:assimilatory nitrate reductase catalytic subunit
MNARFREPKRTLTTCPYCGVGCGIVATPDKHGGAAISGDAGHPANKGRLCTKGLTLGETFKLDTRLLHPMLRGADGALARASWDDALFSVSDGFRRIIERDGAQAVAFYLSGQLLTEDYYVANKLMKGFIGSANVDTNSRLCMASAVAAHRRAFGADAVPGVYADLDEADLIVLVGSNTAWCHPVLFRRMVETKRTRGAKIVVIDPRRTATAEDADLFLSVAPGMDTALFAGLLVHLAEQGALDRDYIDAHTTGFGDALARSRVIAPDVAATAAATGLDTGDVQTFFDLFRATRRVVTCFSQGVNQSAQGTDKINAIINCHLATGRIGKPGAGPFSLTGQPNAMGGREVGGLANQLAAHMDFSPAHVERVGRFWTAPHMAAREGLKAVQMFDAIARGEIKALWVMATNPAVSLPRAAAVQSALRKLELLVVSENVISNDTIRAGPHVLLPATAWGEKDGTVTNSERRISRQRAFLSPPGEANPDWWIVTEIARRLGYADAFAYRNAADIFREHAALSAFENDGARDFDIGALATLSDEAYDSLEPVQWPLPKRSPPDVGEKRFFANGGFFTADRRARFIAPEPPALKEETSPAFRFRLNTGRIRDQWHTMTRTGLSARLAGHLSEPFVEVHPNDAEASGLADGALARIETAHGACVLRVMISEGQQLGSLFVPIHWSAETASDARIGDLVSAQIDPYSGQPEAKATPAAIAPLDLPFGGFVRTREAMTLPQGTWWTKVPLEHAVELRFATDRGLLYWHDVAQRLLGGDGLLVEQLDGEGRVYCAASVVDGAFEDCLAVGASGNAPRVSLIRAMVAGHQTEPEAIAICRQVQNVAADSGPVICACFGVGVEAILRSVSEGAGSVAMVGAALGAGTNCGSCLPELKRIIAKERRATTA